MRLPFSEQAVVEDAKLTEYLLSPTHPQGQGKAIFFGALGFQREQPDALRRALLQLAGISDIDETVFEYGKKYAGTGTLHSAAGKEVQVSTVWMLRDGLPPPFLVTAYPGEAQR
jgi:hypothetical protein